MTKIGHNQTEEEFLDQSLHKDEETKNLGGVPKPTDSNVDVIDNISEYTLIKDFLASPCSCEKSCKDSLSFDEVAKARKEFRSLGWVEKNAFMLSQLSVFMRYTESRSARQTKIRVRQKFDYHISIDRPVCKEALLFYYGETVTHGMPDPGRDLRHGNGRLRILLSSVLHHTSVHRSYELSLQTQKKPCVGYRTFVRYWQETCPHIVFSKPRTDLCMACEDFKKEINKITSDLDEKRDDEKLEASARL